MNFISRARAGCLPIVVLALGLFIAILIPAVVGLGKFVKTQSPLPGVEIFAPEAETSCTSPQDLTRNLRDISKSDLLTHIESRSVVMDRRIEASTLVAAITQANQTKSHGGIDGELWIIGSEIEGSVHVEGLQNRIPVEMESTVIKGNLYIERSEQAEHWHVDTVTGHFMSYHSKLSEFTLSCAQQFLPFRSEFSADVEIASVQDAVIKDSKFDASLAVGTVLPAERTINVPQFFMSNSSVSETTRLGICSSSQEFSIDDSTLGEMDVQTYDCGSDGPAPSSRFKSYLFNISDSKFQGKVNLSGLQTPSLYISKCTFSDLVDLSHARVDSRAYVSDVDFEKELSLFEADLTYKPPHWGPFGIFIYRTRIDALRLQWEQLADQRDWTHAGAYWYGTKVKNVLNEVEWDQIEHAVAKIDNSTHTLNEIRFHRLALNMVAEPSVGKVVQFIGWGFGYRPLWLTAWIVGFMMLYAYIYWREAKSVNSASGGLVDWTRLNFAISFSLRTALFFTFGPKNSRTTIFKVITVSEALLIKVLLVLLLDSLTRISPLLNDIARSIIPS
jgi:hypothetical protein